ncbi:MAG: AraC family transcriptional regulator ligand-binding domain-containing protein [Flavobacteriales bacterium]|nr:AraC family transcriptional regulator ligand-binding domain-containing protein [Flavobacteriales bacterium]
MGFSGRFVMNMAQVAGSNGADMSELIQLSGAAPEQLCREDFFVEVEQYNAVVEAAVAQTKDAYFGLHAAENLNVSAAGLIAQITQTCETVKQALDYCCEFASLGCSALPMSLELVNGEYKLTLIPDPLWANKSAIALRHTAEGVLAFTVKEFQTLTRNAHYPILVHLPWEATKSTKEFTRVFGCATRFNQDEIAMFFKKEHVESKVVTSDFELLRVLVAHATQKVAQLANTSSFREVVKRSIVNLIKPEFPTINDVASHLNLSVRTLQRRLSEDGISFKSLLEQFKLEYAIDYLNNPVLTVSEIAYLLGYSNASTFIRAFKKQTGKTPKEHQRNS